MSKRFYRLEKVKIICSECDYVYYDKPEENYDTICPKCGLLRDWSDVYEDDYKELEVNLDFLKAGKNAP